MNEQQKVIYERIRDFAIDEGDPVFAFEQRLARENSWSTAYAQRVIDEYKRFVFLAVAAGHPVTPSDQVDQVWHLHLTFTRSYWQRLCDEVLETPLHHGPTRGGDDERSKFNDWYGRTQDSYRRLFGAEPPADIWPDARIRFGRDLNFRRVNTSRNWVVTKPGSKAILAAIVLVVVGAIVVTTVSKPDDGAGSGELVLATAGTGSGGYRRPPEVDRALRRGSPGELQAIKDKARQRQQQRRKQTENFTLIAVGSIFAVIIVGCVVNAYFRRRCSGCKRAWVMKSTGKTGKGSVLGGKREEWKCPHCEHVKWLTKPSRSRWSTGDGGGGGCGGCGGCGG